MAWAPLHDLAAFINTPEIFYPSIIFALFVVPQIFVRFMIPPALTVFALGSMLGSVAAIGPHDPTINIFSTIGISSLFLFAGLEIDFNELKTHRRFLIEHMLIRFLLLFGASLLMAHFLNLGFVSASLLSLALFTPSTGFILDNLKHSPFPTQTKLWIRLQAIAGEIVALVLMFVLMRSKSAYELSTSSLALVAFLLFVPIVFKMFAKFVIPKAPGSEFAFLIMFAVLAGLITKKLGAYYLVGAFVVGVGARSFGTLMPSIASENIVNSLRNFSSFFMPFYFLHAGIDFSVELISFTSVMVGSALALVVGLIRVFTVCLHRKISLGESLTQSMPISVSLLPNLVFGLVLASFLDLDKTFPSWLLGGLVVYTVFITAVPPLVLLLNKSFATSEVVVDSGWLILSEEAEQEKPR